MIQIISLILLILSLGTFSPTEALSAIEKDNKAYFWQVEEYKNLTENFKEDLEDEYLKEEVPDGNKETYLWQVGKYKNISDVFSDLIAENVKDVNIPAGNDAKYLWQMSAYKNQTNEYKDINNNWLAREDRLSEVLKQGIQVNP